MIWRQDKNRGPIYSAVQHGRREYCSAVVRHDTAYKWAWLHQCSDLTLLQWNIQQRVNYSRSNTHSLLSDSLKLNADWNARHTLQDFALLSVCLCPEPFRWWLLLLYSLLSKEDSTPFATLLASMHPWGPSNRFSSGGGSGGGGRSKHKEVEGLECMNNVWSLDHKEEIFFAVSVP